MDCDSEGEPGGPPGAPPGCGRSLLDAISQCDHSTQSILMSLLEIKEAMCLRAAARVGRSMVDAMLAEAMVVSQHCDCIATSPLNKRWRTRVKSALEAALRMQSVSELVFAPELEIGQPPRATTTISQSINAKNEVQHAAHSTAAWLPECSFLLRPLLSASLRGLCLTRLTSLTIAASPAPDTLWHQHSCPLLRLSRDLAASLRLLLPCLEHLSLIGPWVFDHGQPLIGSLRQPHTHRNNMRSQDACAWEVLRTLLFGGNSSGSSSGSNDRGGGGTISGHGSCSVNQRAAQDAGPDQCEGQQQQKHQTLRDALQHGPVPCTATKPLRRLELARHLCWDLLRLPPAHLRPPGTAGAAAGGGRTGAPDAIGPGQPLQQGQQQHLQQQNQQRRPPHPLLLPQLEELTVSTHAPLPPYTAVRYDRLLAAAPYLSCLTLVGGESDPAELVLREQRMLLRARRRREQRQQQHQHQRHAQDSQGPTQGQDAQLMTSGVGSDACASPGRDRAGQEGSDAPTAVGLLRTLVLREHRVVVRGGLDAAYHGTWQWPWGAAAGAGAARAPGQQQQQLLPLGGASSQTHHVIELVELVAERGGSGGGGGGDGGWQECGSGSGGGGRGKGAMHWESGAAGVGLGAGAQGGGSLQVRAVDGLRVDELAALVTLFGAWCVLPLALGHAAGVSPGMLGLGGSGCWAAGGLARVSVERLDWGHVTDEGSWRQLERWAAAAAAAGSSAATARGSPEDAAPERAAADNDATAPGLYAAEVYLAPGWRPGDGWLGRVLAMLAAPPPVLKVWVSGADPGELAGVFGELSALPAGLLPPELCLACRAGAPLTRRHVAEARVPYTGLNHVRMSREVHVGAGW